MRANVLANFIGQGTTAVLGLALIPLYVRLLGAEAYGLVGLFAALQAWLVVLDLGTGPALNREMALFRTGSVSAAATRDLIRSLEYILGGLALMLCAIVAIAAPWIAESWLQPSQLDPAVVATSIALMGCLIGLRLLESIYRSALFGLELQVDLNAVLVSSALFRAAGSVALLTLLDGSVTQFFIWQVVVSVLSLLTFALLLYRALPKAGRRGHFSRHAIVSIRGFAGGVLVITALGLMLSQVDKIAISRFEPLSQVGFYAACWSLATGLFFFSGPITQAVFPRLTHLWAAGDDKALARTFHLGTQAIFALAGTAGMMLIVLGGDVVRFWLGADAGASPWVAVLALLVLGTICNVLVQMPFFAQLACGWTRLGATANVIIAPLFVPAVFVTVAHYGVVAGATGWLIVNAILLCVVSPFTFTRVLRGELGRWALHDVLLPAIALVTVGLVSLAAVRAQPEWAVAIALAGSVVGFAVVIALSKELATALLSSTAKVRGVVRMRGRLHV